jgi:dihydrofolate reductase
MRKIVSSFFISLDGVIESPDQWHFPYFNDEMGAVVGGGMEAADAMLLGRVTYDGFAEYWPQQPSDVPPADFMNGVQKYVVSKSLTSADWQNTTLLRDISELAGIKAQPGKDINIVGSAALVGSLIEAGLLDELSLLVHPIVVGKGQKLFPDGFAETRLKLVSSKTLETGVLHLVYTVEK